MCVLFSWISVQKRRTDKAKFIVKLYLEDVSKQKDEKE